MRARTALGLSPHRLGRLPRVGTLGLAALMLAACASASTSTGAPGQTATPRGVAPETTSSATAPATAEPTEPTGTPSSPPSPTPSGTLSSVTRATAARIIARSTVPVLCYHQIRPYTAKDNGYARAITTPPGRFAEQIEALRKAGYHSITPEQLRAHLVDGETLPSKPVLITFDDGTRPQWTAAGPILEKAGYTATYFPMTVVLNKDGWLRDSDLRAMHAAGFAIGSHTWDHHDVREYRRKDWRVQLDGSLQTLQRAIDEPVTTFAFPYGAWNDAALAPLARRGIDLAFQLSDKPVSTKTPLLTQRRLLMYGSWSGKDVLREIRQQFPRAEL